MILFLFIHMTGPVDRRSDLTAAHQPRPIRVEARLLDKDGSEAGRLDAIVRPDGWTVPGQERADRVGIELPFVLSAITGMNKPAHHLVAFDMPETDWAVRVCRAMTRGKQPEWIRPPQLIVDVAQDARELLDRAEGTLTLAEATTALLGSPVPGVEGVMALYHHDGIAKMRRAA